MLKKISPLFLLLFLFSCASENLVKPLEEAEIVDPSVFKEKYPTDCDIMCQTPDYVNVSLHGNCGLSIDWGYESQAPPCGDFIIMIQDQATGVYTTYYTTTAPFLTPTLPCSDYIIKVSHLTSNCASVFRSSYFAIDTKACCVAPPPPPTSYCTATGVDPSCLHAGYIHLAFADRWEEVYSLDSRDLGYADLTNIEMNVAPGEVIEHTLLGICHCLSTGATIYKHLWIDINQNFIFESSELMFSHAHYMSPGTGSPNPNPLLNCQSFEFQGFTFPAIEACGLRARYIITTDPNAGPCSTFATGQVVDFTINSSNCL